MMCSNLEYHATWLQNTLRDSLFMLTATTETLLQILRLPKRLILLATSAAGNESLMIIGKRTNALKLSSLLGPQRLSQYLTLRSVGTMATIDTNKTRWWASDSSTPNIFLFNSLTRRKVEFKPIKDGEVSWYVCGPTVYDDAHLGHARNYVTTDIIRRIIRDYFQFKVHFVMNITDVDDKIILRGRQQHLLARYRAENAGKMEDARELANQALKEYVAKRLPLINEDVTAANARLLVEKNYGWLQHGNGRPEGVATGSDDEAKLKMHVGTVSRASEAMLAAPEKSTENVFYEGVEDVLLPYLDAREGSKIDASDHSIFTKLTVKYEDRFMQDMRDLNVLEPDELTRVTEYGQGIIDYVKQIEQNGFAYKTDDGSVYFDISAFENRGNQYAKLRPENRGDKALQADGEGALSKASAKKRSDADFALWKSSKPGEPSWDSPWGKGRPGWHIECSAMATDKLGSQIDIHSGGIDLAFPHHDNELAQSEAYLRDSAHDHEHTWVNYFLHMGHLSIQGAKMSKSLKNFTTIRSALEQKQWTSRSLRIVFLLGAWKDGIEITDEMVQAGNSWEERVNNFFLNAIDLANSNVLPSDNSADKEVSTKLQQTTQKTQTALADSFDTYRAMQEISSLISVFNTADKLKLSPRIAEEAARWVTFMVNVFGLNGDAKSDSSQLGWSGVTVPEEAQRFIYPLSRFRDLLRRKARGAGDLTQDDLGPPKPLVDVLASAPKGDSYAEVAASFVEGVSKMTDADAKSSKQQILALCDELRDTHLWSQNIYLEDRDKEQLPALVRPVTTQMKEERETQVADRAKKEREKAAAKAKREADEASNLAKGKLSPLEMFKTAEFSAWDEEGIPTKDAKGEEIAKSRWKKLKKESTAQKKLHEKWRASQA